MARKTRVPLTFTLVGSLPADAAAGLPEGRMEVLIAPGRNGSPKVQALYLKLVNGDGRVASCDSFDDGRVVVDRDARGRVVGFEFLAHREPAELKQFVREGQKAVGSLALAAVVTAMNFWAFLDAVLGAVKKHGLATNRRQARKVITDLTRPYPAAAYWTRMKVDDLAFAG